MSGNNKKDKDHYKKKLEHKLYLARESPEPVFDLSDCDLKQVPTGIYSLCRVFLKDVLNLGVNRLSVLTHGGSLSDLKNLTVLDLHQNKFETLTEDIKYLAHLRELYLHDNQLIKLPDSLPLLEHLTILTVANNALRVLPESIGNLSKLHTLSLENNPKLKKLPVSFCGLRSLQTLSLNADQFLYPPPEICQDGPVSIVEFILNEIGIPYENTHIRRSSEDMGTEKPSFESTAQNFEAKIAEIEKQKLKKKSVMLKIEEERDSMRQQEMKFQDEKRKDQKKLWEKVAEDQWKIDARLSEIQNEKDFEKKKFMNELRTKEIESDKAIRKFMEQTKLNISEAAQQLDFDRREHNRLFENVKKVDQLKREEILEGMKFVLEKESTRFQEYNKTKDQTVRTVLLDETNQYAYMDDAVKQRLQDNQHLAEQLHQDDELQKIAVGKLLERSDARSWALLQLVNFVSNQLANLTSIELDKRKLKIDQQINDLAEKRSDLCAQLVDLIDKKQKRQSYLLAELHEMDKHNNRDPDFWLLQYQRLIDRQPQLIKNIQRNLEPEFLQEMVLNGVIQCLPFLAPWAYSKQALAKVTDDDLSKAGITKKTERKTILGIIANHIKQGKQKDKISKPSASAPVLDTPSGGSATPPAGSTPLLTEPTAPPLDPTAPQISPTAPPHSSGVTAFECVICMDNYCEVVYIPCGHICTCMTCSTSVEICPICRAEILKRIKLIAP